MHNTSGETQDSEQGMSTREKLIMLIQVIGYACLGYVFGILMITFVGSVAKVPTLSMYPTIQAGDRLLLSPIPLYSNEPQRGDIITFKQGSIKLVKRVIGLPNETIDIVDGYITIDGVLLDESTYLGPGVYTYAFEDSLVPFPYVIPDDCYFMMGDNRENSVDSRKFGAVTRSHIKDSVLLRVFPFNHMGEVA